MLQTMTVRTTTAPKKRGRVENLRKGSPKGVRQGGRAKGTPNKVTVEFRDTVRMLLETNAGNVAVWLGQVAHGVATGRQEVLTGELDEKGKPKFEWRDFVLPGGSKIFSAANIVAGVVPSDVHISWIVEPDPDKAMQRLTGLAEFAAPKLARTEVVGDPNAPLQATILTVDPAQAAAEYARMIRR